MAVEYRQLDSKVGQISWHCCDIPEEELQGGGSGSDPLMLAVGGRRAEGMGEDETAAMSEMTGIFCQALVSDLCCCCFLRRRVSYVLTKRFPWFGISLLFMVIFYFYILYLYIVKYV